MGPQSCSHQSQWNTRWLPKKYKRAGGVLKPEPREQLKSKNDSQWADLKGWGQVSEQLLPFSDQVCVEQYGLQ